MTKSKPEIMRLAKYFLNVGYKIGDVEQIVEKYLFSVFNKRMEKIKKGEPLGIGLGDVSPFEVGIPGAARARRQPVVTDWLVEHHGDPITYKVLRRLAARQLRGEFPPCKELTQIAIDYLEDRAPKLKKRSRWPGQLDRARTYLAVMMVAKEGEMFETRNDIPTRVSACDVVAKAAELKYGTVKRQFEKEKRSFDIQYPGFLGELIDFHFGNASK